MRIVSLVFSYDFDRMKSSGRVWSHTGYRGKDYIQTYSAASIATFLHHNPEKEYIVNTDDVEGLMTYIEKYDVSTKNLKLVDWSDRLREWKEHEYCFFPAMMHSLEHALECKKNGEGFLKLDNDLTCKKNIDVLIDGYKGAILWKKERNVSEGRYYWSERYVCEQTVGTDNFFGYNIGVLGFSNEYIDCVKESFDVGLQMSRVDVSNVIHFPEDPGYKSKIFACCEQTGYSWILHKRNIPIVTSEEYFDHHCYAKTKQGCIDAAEFLKKVK